jgi:hypothetical protein
MSVVVIVVVDTIHVEVSFGTLELIIDVEQLYPVDVHSNITCKRRGINR